jgi:mono/diheme cytochrome c family protein
MHDVILNGLVKMPAWKYTLKEQDVSDIIAYVRTLPEPPPPTTKGGGLGAD